MAASVSSETIEQSVTGYPLPVVTKLPLRGHGIALARTRWANRGALASVGGTIVLHGPRVNPAPSIVSLVEKSPIEAESM